MKRLFAARAFLVAGLLFLLSAAVPVFRGQRSNTAYLAAGIALLLIGAGVARRARSDP
jgi:LPXTG-motif cell wall-anchored protein